MKYFLDTEFIEGFKKPVKWLPTIGNFNKPYHSIQLISIGIVCEDGREYYAVSNEFNPDDANGWVQENVLAKLPAQFEIIGFNIDESPNYHDTWKSNERIAQEIFRFINDVEPQSEKLPIEFYAYYADYDWVVFCSLFGTMMDLPKGFPMYCRDLKQSIDEHVMKVIHLSASPADREFKSVLEVVKTWPNYPKQTNEHNALDDAKWNFELFKFLKTL